MKDMDEDIDLIKFIELLFTPILIIGVVLYYSLNFVVEYFQKNNQKTFKKYIRDNYISTDITELNISDKNLTDLEGIEKFTKLEFLYCDNNKITSLKGIEHLNNLILLDCSGNQLTDLKEIDKLKNLKCLHLYSDITNELEIVRKLILTKKEKEKISDII